MAELTHIVGSKVSKFTVLNFLLRLCLCINSLEMCYWRGRKEDCGMEGKLYLSKGNYEYSFLSANLLCQYFPCLKVLQEGLRNFKGA